MKPSTYCALVAAVAIITFASGESGRNPCHPGRNVDKLGASCEGIYMPPKMCSRCKLSRYNSKGSFLNCQAIYKIDDPACKAQIGYYVRLNKCDTIRAKQFNNFNNFDNRRALDYFVYSVCEECCDCIPRGARPSQYKERRQRGPDALLSLVRGNCPAHAHYDICRVWPQLRHMANPGKKLNLKLPKICPIIRSWFFSPLSKNWSSNDNTKMDDRIKRFLRFFMTVARCRNRDTWNSCAALETAQRRI